MTRFGNVKGIVFDLDGTLIDSYEAITDSLNAALRAADLPPMKVDAVRGMVGMGLETLIARAMGEERVAEGVRVFREHYDRVCVAGTSVLPEVAETLDALHRRGYRMAVASNKPAHFGWRLLEGLHLRRFMTCVLGPDVVANRKPHPEMVFRAMREMQTGTRDTLYVGDMDVDVETARAAGVPVIVVPTGSRSAEDLRSAGADMLIDAFHDLLGLLPG
ncbi:MAG TPA: HAD-IA family hydrolase, partial [Candidatus Saccharimonadales bacterium]|nr:HAD-IA family hydrolase [Candidatus Saccharimonadales bacterium]